MTYEYATYFKILLLCGYDDELQQYIENALAEQDPISDIILTLSTVNGDGKKSLSVLNKYLLQIKAENIDYDKAVFDLIMSFLQKKYLNEAMSMKQIA